MRISTGRIGSFGFLKLLEGVQSGLSTLRLSLFPVDPAQGVMRLGVGRIKLGGLLQLSDSLGILLLLFQEHAQLIAGFGKFFIVAQGLSKVGLRL